MYVTFDLCGFSGRAVSLLGLLTPLADIEGPEVVAFCSG